MSRFQIATDRDYALLRHPHPVAVQPTVGPYPAGEPYRTWNPPMPNYYAVPPAGDPSGYYVPHQFVHPYMRVYPAPSWVGPARYGRKDATLMGSANRHLAHPPRQHLMPPTSHSVTPGMAPFVQRVPWNSYDPWTTAPGLLSDEDADLVFGDDSDLLGDDAWDDAPWFGDDYDDDEDDYGDEFWLGAEEEKLKKKLRPFKALSKLFTRKEGAERSQAEDLADQIAKIQRTLGRREAAPPPAPAPIVVAPPQQAPFPWKTAGLVAAGGVALLLVGLVAGKKLLA